MCEFIFHKLYNKNDRKDYVLLGKELNFKDTIGVSFEYLDIDLPFNDYITIETSDINKSVSNTMRWMRFIKNI